MKIKKRIQFDIEVDDSNTELCSIMCTHCVPWGDAVHRCTQFDGLLSESQFNDEDERKSIIFRCDQCLLAETVSGAA